MYFPHLLLSLGIYPNLALKASIHCFPMYLLSLVQTLKDHHHNSMYLLTLVQTLRDHHRMRRCLTHRSLSSEACM